MRVARSPEYIFEVSALTFGPAHPTRHLELSDPHAKSLSHCLNLLCRIATRAAPRPVDRVAVGNRQRFTSAPSRIRVP